MLKSFVENETNPEWLPEQLNRPDSYAERMAERRPEIELLQRRLAGLEKDITMQIVEFKELNRDMSIGAAKARRAKKEMDGLNMPAYGL